MMHRACHLSADALALRPFSLASEHIQQAVSDLLEQHRQWCERAIVREAHEKELAGELLSTVRPSNDVQSSVMLALENILPTLQTPVDEEAPPLQFLEYPLVHLTNFFFANLLNHWRSIEIYLSLIPHPQWGYYNPRRFQSAIDVCRTHAALGKERNFLTTGKIWGLHLAGVTFGGPDLYPVYATIL